MFFVFTAAYLCSRRAELYRRGRRSWAAIVKKLLPGLEESATNAEAAADLDKSFTNGTIERLVWSRQGRRAMFREAGAMIEMAEYAERNGGKDAAAPAASLRSHALAIRVSVAKVLLRRTGHGQK